MISEMFYFTVTILESYVKSFASKDLSEAYMASQGQAHPSKNYPSRSGWIKKEESS